MASERIARRLGSASRVGAGRTRYRAYDRPMLLAIDVGNTNVTIGLVARRRARSRSGAQRPTPRRRPTSSSCCSTACCASTATPRRRRAIAGVVGRAGADRVALAPWPSARPPLVRAGAGTLPLPVRVDRPGEVGADRLVNAFAAHRLLRLAGGGRRHRHGDDGGRVARDGAFPRRRDRAGPETRSARRSPRGPRSCRASLARPSGRSGATPSRRSRRQVLGYLAPRERA